MNTDDAYSTRAEVAAYLKVGPSTVSNYASVYGMPYHLVGGVKRYRLREVEEWIEKRTQEARRMPIQIRT